MNFWAQVFGVNLRFHFFWIGTKYKIVRFREAALFSFFNGANLLFQGAYSLFCSASNGRVIQFFSLFAST